MPRTSPIQRQLLEEFKNYITQPIRPPLSQIAPRLEMLAEVLRMDDAMEEEWIDIWPKLREWASAFLSRRHLRLIERRIEEIKAAMAVWEWRLDHSDKVVFLLGAGASAPSGIPTVQGLLPHLWKRARKIGRDDLESLIDWCSQTRVRNIEDVMTAVYIANAAAKNSSITSLLHYFFNMNSPQARPSYDYGDPMIRARLIMNFSSISWLQDTLQTLFGLLTDMMIDAPPNPAHNAIAEFRREHLNTTIITTNYDLCMDEALIKADVSKREGGRAGGIPIAGEDTLIKMHGSINWTYCDSCQEALAFDIDTVKSAYREDKLSFAVIGICKSCGGQRRPLLVPPMSFKFMMFPALIDIWNSAKRAIDGANYIIAVGFSFSEADNYITKIVSRSMAQNADQKLIVVDINPELARTLRKRFSEQIEGFDEKRIQGVVGSCEKTLPDLLRSLLGKERKSGREEDEYGGVREDSRDVMVGVTESGE